MSIITHAHPSSFEPAGEQASERPQRSHSHHPPHPTDAHTPTPLHLTPPHYPSSPGAAIDLGRDRLGCVVGWAADGRCAIDRYGCTRCWRWASRVAGPWPLSLLRRASPFLIDGMVDGSQSVSPLAASQPAPPRRRPCWSLLWLWSWSSISCPSDSLVMSMTINRCGRGWTVCRGCGSNSTLPAHSESMYAARCADRFRRDVHINHSGHDARRPACPA